MLNLQISLKAETRFSVVRSQFKNESEEGGVANPMH